MCSRLRLVLLISLTLSTLLGDVKSTIEYNDEYGCYPNCSISAYNELILCDGYKSCFNASLIESRGSEDVKCRGSFACAHAASINIYITGDNFYCDGLFSCAFVDNIYVSTRGMYCYGEKSCYSSNIILNETGLNNNIYCDASEGVSNSIIYGIKNIYLRGYGCGINSVFHSVISDNITAIPLFVFAALFSGYNGTIYCRNNGECEINCHSNGCTNLQLFCGNNSDISSCNYTVRCYATAIDYYIYNNPCSLYYNLTNVRINIIDNYDDPGFLLNLQNESYILDDVWTLDTGINSISNDINSIYEYRNNTFFCGSAQGSSIISNKCNNTSLISFSDETKIICGGVRSCDSKSMYIKKPYNNNKKNNDSSSSIIACDSHSTCDGMNVTCINNDINIYFSGTNAGINIPSIYLNNSNSNSNNIMNIYCTGYSSCYSISSIYNPYNIYCFGYWSCRSIDAYNVLNNIYTTGYFAMQGGKIYGINGSIFCSGQQACKNGFYYNISGDVYGIGPSVFWFSTIDTANNVSLHFVLFFFFFFCFCFLFFFFGGFVCDQFNLLSIYLYTHRFIVSV